jgi:hypothetical protein
MDAFMVARAPFVLGRDQIPPEGIVLQSPYIQDNQAIIKEAQDVTVSITTIAGSLFSKYRDFYRADDFGNDHFAVLSSSGLGNANNKLANVKVHHIKSYAKLKSDIEGVPPAEPDIGTIYAENVMIIEDYRSNGKQERLYLAFHAFCQDLENTPLEKLVKAISSVGGFTGGLAPFSLISNVASGVNNLFRKIQEIEHEVKTVEFGLYPAMAEKSPAPGDAPLQTGTYIFFFELTDIIGLRLYSDGVVKSDTGKVINPYVVVNIKPEVILAPDELSTSAAIAVLEGFQSGPEFSAKGSEAPYFAALKELGKSYRLAEQTRRYFVLKQKGNGRTPEENTKFATIVAALKQDFPDWDAETV